MGFHLKGMLGHVNGVSGFRSDGRNDHETRQEKNNALFNSLCNKSAHNSSLLQTQGEFLTDSDVPGAAVGLGTSSIFDVGRLRAPNKMSVAPRTSDSVSGKEGEAGHLKMVDGA